MSEDDGTGTLTIDGVSYPITPLSSLGDVSESHVNVTVAIEALDSRGTKDAYRLSGRVMDVTEPSVQIVVWDEDLIEEYRPYEGEAVALCNVEVGEYEGRLQLKPVEGTTEIHHIEHGTGYTPSRPEDPGQFLDERTETF